MLTNRQKIYVTVLKPIIDFLLAFIILIFFGWVYVACVLMIILDSGFPVIYKQIRIGKSGNQFGIYKFRTMVKDADKIGPTATKLNDSRITKIGDFLRKTSLDELPQLFNILKGEMSFVGFRPDVPRDTDDYSHPKYMLKPGITGMAQVNGRSNITIEKKDFCEREYTKTVSLITDFKIFLKTIGVVLKKEGTN